MFLLKIVPPPFVFSSNNRKYLKIERPVLFSHKMTWFVSFFSIRTKSWFWRNYCIEFTLLQHTDLYRRCHNIWWWSLRHRTKLNTENIEWVFQYKKKLFVCSITAKILGQILTLDWTREILCTKNCFYRHPWKVDRIPTCDTGICFINASKMYLKYSKCGVDVPKCINKQ